MLPSNAPSTFPMPALVLAPDDRVTSALIDYERGGVAINNPTLGHNVQNWTCWLDGLKVKLAPQDGQPVVLFERANVTELSFTFDQNMQPVVTFVASGETFLWWYDSTVSGYVFTSFGTGLKTPRVSLDDKREVSRLTSDVIFAYIRYHVGSNSYGLFYRQQRDRYTVEQTLRTGLSPTTMLKNMAMSTNWRLQFELV